MNKRKNISPPPLPPTAEELEQRRLDLREREIALREAEFKRTQQSRRPSSRWSLLLLLGVCLGLAAIPSRVPRLQLTITVAPTLTAAPVPTKQETTPMPTKTSTLSVEDRARLFVERVGGLDVNKVTLATDSGQRVLMVEVPALDSPKANEQPLLEAISALGEADLPVDIIYVGARNAAGLTTYNIRVKAVDAKAYADGELTAAELLARNIR